MNANSHLPELLAVGDPDRIKGKYGDGYQIITWDGEDVPASRYDRVVLDHIMQQATRTQAQLIIERFIGGLRPGGQLILVVPSLEWACNQIASADDPDIMAFLSIYGTDEELHKCGFTLPWLRLLVERAGLRIDYASGEYYIADVNGNKSKVMQNVVMASRRFVEEL